VSNFNLEELQRIIKTGKVVPSVNQVCMPISPQLPRLPKPVRRSSSTRTTMRHGRTYWRSPRNMAS
jgi:hypothetical protein